MTFRLVPLSLPLPFALTRSPRASFFLAGVVCLLLAKPAAADALEDVPERPSRETEPSPSATLGEPLFELESAEIRLVYDRSGSDRGVTIRLDVQRPVLRVVKAKETPDEEKEEPVPSSGEVLREAAPLPFEAEVVALHDAAVVFLDSTLPGRELLRIHGLEALVENVATERSRSAGLPALVTARGRIGREGRVALFATLNTWTGEPDFAGRAQVVGLHLQELSGFVQEATDQVPTQGTLAAFVEFSVRDGRIEGGVKPIISGLELAAPGSSWLEEVQTWLVEGAAKLLSDDVRDREAVAGVIPISGRLKDPQMAPWDAVVSVLKNAFVEALSAGFAEVAPARGETR